MDTHTSVASYVCECYQKNSGDDKKCVIASTASPYKFVKSVMSAIDPKYADQDEFSLLKVLEETSGREMPQAIKDILNANILHDLECDADKMKDTVKEYSGSIERLQNDKYNFCIDKKYIKCKISCGNLAFCAL